MDKLQFKLPSINILALVFCLLCACQEVEPRAPILLGVVPVSMGAPEGIDIDNKSGRAYILNKGNHIGVLEDMDQIALLESSADLFVNPSDLAIDEDNNLVYVVNQLNDTVAIIQNTVVLGIIETAGTYPQAVAVEPESGWAYIVGPYRKGSAIGEGRVVEGHVTVLRGTEIVGDILLNGISLWHVAVDPVGGYIYVAGREDILDNSSGKYDSKGIVVVLRGLEEVGRIEIPYQINSMDIDSKSGQLYAIDGRNLYWFEQANLSGSMKIVKGNDYIKNLQVHPVTGDVYMVNWGSKTEAIVVRDGAVAARIEIGPSSLKMAMDPYSGNVYIADFWFNTMDVIHGTEVIATLDTGLYPYGIAVNGSNGRVYVSNTNEGTISIFGFEE